jgi:hypothetical protein
LNIEKVSLLLEMGKYYTMCLGECQ